MYLDALSSGPTVQRAFSIIYIQRERGRERGRERERDRNRERKRQMVTSFLFYFKARKFTLIENQKS